jgi:hypothetical protein
VLTLAARPELADDAPPSSAEPRRAPFMQGDLTALLTRADRLTPRWSQYVVVALDDGVPVARWMSGPFAAAENPRTN